MTAKVISRITNDFFGSRNRPRKDPTEPTVLIRVRYQMKERNFGNRLHRYLASIGDLSSIMPDPVITLWGPWAEEKIACGALRISST